MRRDSQRLFLHSQFLGLVTVLWIQITEIVIVKLNSNGCRRASCSCALGVHGKSRVLLLFKFQNNSHWVINYCLKCVSPLLYFSIVKYHNKKICSFTNNTTITTPHYWKKKAGFIGNYFPWREIRISGKERRLPHVELLGACCSILPFSKMLISYQETLLPTLTSK